MFKRCPSAEQLSEFAIEAKPARIARHVAGCDTCRQTLDELRKNEKLLAELREANAASVDEKTRRRLVTLCGRVRASAAREGRDETAPPRS